jgi:MFS family permease
MSEFQELTNEGGIKGWIIVAAATMINIMTYGISFSFGVFQDEYKKNVFKNESTLSISFVGTIAGSLTSLLSVIILKIIHKRNIKNVMLLGTIIMSLGLIIASFSNKLWQLYLTQGIMFGIGSSMLYIPSINSVPQWFNKRRGLAMGIVLSGTGIGGLIMTLLTNYIIEKYNWKWALRVLGILNFITMSFCSIIIKQRYQFNKAPEFLNKNLITNLKFIANSFAGFFQAAGYLIPMYFMTAFSQSMGFSINTSALFLGINNGISAIGKIILGYTADKYGRINALLLCCFISTTSVLCLWLIETRSTFIGFVIINGFFAGGFVSLFPTVIIDIFGIENFAMVNSFIYFMRGLGIFIGTPLGGLILDNTNGYKYVIVYDGILFGLTAICVIYIRSFYKKLII